MNIITLREATERWLSTFSRIPGTVIEKLVAHDEAVGYYDGDSFRLVASPGVTCRECDDPYEGDLSLPALNRLQIIGEGVACEYCGLNTGDGWTMAPPKHAFPCGWGTLFVPSDSCDQSWLGIHREEVAALGFYVFESEDFGYLLGIDAGGFDFYDGYWIPLYELRGLQWHKSGA